MNIDDGVLDNFLSGDDLYPWRKIGLKKTFVLQKETYDPIVRAKWLASFQFKLLNEKIRLLAKLSRTEEMELPDLSYESNDFPYQKDEHAKILIFNRAVSSCMLRADILKLRALVNRHRQE